MTNAELDTMILARNRFDAVGLCRACGGNVTERRCRDCTVCMGDGGFVMGEREAVRLIDHAEALRGIVGDLCEESVAVRELVRLRSAMEELAARIYSHADDRPALMARVRAALRGEDFKVGDELAPAIALRHPRAKVKEG